MPREFTHLLRPEEAKALFQKAFTPRPRGTEVVPLLEAFGRVLARDIIADMNLPPFDRSTVDGYAIRASDVADFNEALTIAGEVRMGELPVFSIGPREAARIPTGGALPSGADAVVMQEHVRLLDDRRIQLTRPVAVWENVIRKGEDVREGEVVLRAGTRLRPQEVALLAGLGRTEVEVYLVPRVAVIVTGDEIVPPEHFPRPGQIRDMNTYSLTGLIRGLGAVAHPYGIVVDEREVLLDVLRRASRTADMILVSGGSSVGERDVVAEAFTALGATIVVHGVAIKPGKPTILAIHEGKPLMGLPGHPVSAMVVFDVFVRELLEGMLGLTLRRGFGKEVRAKLARSLGPAKEREEHVRVALEERNGQLWAVPIIGKSGVITTMVKADGIVVVPVGGAVLPEGTEVDVRLFD
ncbi:MAG: molybdopterin molybdotransferase MoeA [Armatimonadota bacterium]|nr:molybdopterin molybdotransferase MoeA [Armatimonadota bacterium]MDR5703728.1 molybdopterin molybdotransferase MoeA [Armatimonadota bacterium]